jgi:hypothetical protein
MAIRLVSRCKLIIISSRSELTEFNDREVSEWLKVHAWKACLDANPTGVRIPLSLQMVEPSQNWHLKSH